MTATIKNKIITFQENSTGIDYVIGDIHGRFDLVYKSLETVNFNPPIDRIFCVGDLIDRGPYSHHVIDFLNLHYVHAIRGNHEDMLLDFFEQYPNATDSEFYEAGFENGMTWFLNENIHTRKTILDKLSELPLIIEINTSRGLVGLVHADVPQNISWDKFKEEINNGNEKIINTALWGRNRLNYSIEQDVEGLGRLYVGHTVQSHVKKLGNVVALDTGAVFNQHLSMVNIACHSQALHFPTFPKNQNFNIKEQAKTPFSKIKHK
jgi:serine/threonine protein phosphatase 1